MNIDKFLIENGLNFTVEKHPLTATNSTGRQIITPYFALINSQNDAILNTCKSGYTVSQNREIVEMVVNGTKKFGTKLAIVKAGAINNGKQIYIQLECEGEAKLKTTTMKQYITVIDSNDGSTGLSVGIGDKMLHCGNQFFQFYKEGDSRFRHTTTITEKIKKIPFLIETAFSKNTQQVKLYKKFESTKLTANMADEMVKYVLDYDKVLTPQAEQDKMTKRSQKMMETLYADIDTEIANVGKNVFALFNGVTRYTTYHQKPPTREGGNAESLIVGVGYKKAIDALEFCTEKCGLV